MAEDEKTKKTREHELYVRHILLLGEVTPMALKTVIQDIALKQNKSLASILLEAKDTFMNMNDYEESYSALFPQHDINTRIDSWGTQVLCDVTLVLPGGPERTYIQCIRDQRSDLKKYTVSAYMNYNTFKEKWNCLLSAIHELIDNREGKDKFECERLIHSYDESRGIKVSECLIEEMKQTTDADNHIKMAINSVGMRKENREREIDKDGLNNENGDRASNTEIPIHFIQRLEETFVQTNDPVVLACELSTVRSPVKWSRNDKQLAKTETLKYFANGNINVLYISKAAKEDTGMYSCSCGNATTQAFLHVAEQDLKIVEPLHIVEEDTKEDHEITLACKVNIDAKKPNWFHNRKDMTLFCRVLASSQGLEHKLIISRAQLGDGGEYIVAFDRVASRTNIVVKTNFDLNLKQQLLKGDYRNWFRGILGIKILKLGLENVAEIAVQKHHDEIVNSLQTTKQCNLCNKTNLMPRHSKKQCYRKQNNNRCLCSKSPHHRRVCPNGGYCSDVYDLIVHAHRYEDPCLSNTKIERWGSEPWSVATCYINTPGCEGKTDASEIDCAGLLCLFINNKTYFPFSNYCVLNMARNVRNEIFHNPNYELPEQKLIEYLDQFKEVLEEIKMCASGHICANDGFVEERIQELDTLKTHQIEINLAEELRELKNHAMEEEADIIKKAHEQKTKELEHLEERLKLAEKDFQLLGSLRATHSNRKKQIGRTSIKVSLDLELRIMIYANGKDKESPKGIIQRVYGFFYAKVQNEDHHKKKRKVTKLDPNHNGLAEVTNRILQTISMDGSTQVNDVNLVADTGVALKMKCTSSMSIEKILVLVHGKIFQNCIQDLKKCLKEEEKEGETVYDVRACCSSMDIRKELLDNGKLESANYDFRCEKHDGTLNTWYCCDDDTFCCSACVEQYHGTCPTLKQVISNITFNNVIQRSLSVKGRKREYSIRQHNDNDKEMLVNTLCVLPNGKILLCDYSSRSLKKLNTSYKLKSCISLPGIPHHMCYIGNDEVVVLLKDSCKLWFVKVSKDLRIEPFERVLDHIVDCMACHGDTLYTCCQDTVRRCKTDGTQKSIVCKFQSFGDSTARYMAVSDDGEKIHVTNKECLIVISNKGNDLYSFKTTEINVPSHICCVEDGSVLVYDAEQGCILQVDTVSRKVVGKVIILSDLQTMLSKARPTALCYDRKYPRLLVVAEHYGSNYISVYELQRNVLE